MITPDQIRAARALKGWSQGELAARTGLAVPTIANIEIGKQEPSVKTMQKIVDAFHVSGIKFTPRGVEFDEDELFTLEGEGKFTVLLKDMIEELEKSERKELLFYGADDHRSSDDELEIYKTLHEKGITFKRIICDDLDFVHEFKGAETRCISRDVFDNDGVVSVYKNKVAYYCISTKTKPPRTLIINNERIAGNFRKTFDFIWENAKPIPKKMKRIPV